MYHFFEVKVSSSSLLTFTMIASVTLKCYEVFAWVEFQCQLSAHEFNVWSLKWPLQHDLQWASCLRLAWHSGNVYPCCKESMWTVTDSVNMSSITNCNIFWLPLPEYAERLHSKYRVFMSTWPLFLGPCKKIYKLMHCDKQLPCKIIILSLCADVP